VSWQEPSPAGAQAVRCISPPPHGCTPTLIRSLRKSRVNIPEAIGHFYADALINLGQTYIDNQNSKALLTLASEERKLIELGAAAIQQRQQGSAI
jgi:hypothetical protein